MIDRKLNRRRLIKVSVGGVTAAYLAVPGRWTAALTAAQDSNLA